MTGQKILEVLVVYERLFMERGVTPEDVPHDLIGPPPSDQLAHCYGMIPQMRIFIEQRRIEKAFRWLGFIQGVLWANGIFPLETMKNHNRPS